MIAAGNKFCGQCGREVSSRDNFCTSCGSDLAKPNEASVSRSSSQAPLSDLRENEPNVRNPIEYFGGMSWVDKGGTYIVPDVPSPQPMVFTESLKYCFANWLNFQGRASRSEYWYFVCVYPLVTVGMLISLLYRKESAPNAVINTSLSFLVFLGVLVICMAPLPAVGVRRLHDTGHSAAWLLFGLVPFVGSLTILYWLCQEGDAAPNRFGPP